MRRDRIRGTHLATSCRATGLFLGASIAFAQPKEEILVPNAGARFTAFVSERPLNYDHHVASAGDVNGDGFDDFIALRRNELIERHALVVFGRPEFPATVTDVTVASVLDADPGRRRADRSGRRLDRRDARPMGDVDQ